MRSRYVGRYLLATALVASLLPTVTVASPAAAKAPAPVDPPVRPCADMTVPEENHASIRLRVDVPASDAQAAVDEHGKISISGIVHKHATMVDVSDTPVTSSDFVLGPPPDGVAAWAMSWTTTMRPPHLGENTLCARAKRDPKRSARILRSFTVVDLIPPSNVPGLSVSNVTATGAKVTWGAATDNYGLAGYAVTVDGGPAHRTTVGIRSYTITGLAPSTHHTVSVVAVDLAGNVSTTPSTKDFTTAAAPPPPPPPGDLTFDPQQGAATAAWHPDPADVTYRTLLDGQLLEEFPADRYCLDPAGSPASPCTVPDTVSYPLTSLNQGTSYTFQVDALRTDGTVARSLSGSFTTTVDVDLVPPAVAQQIASESSQCAGSGGAFYLSPSTRGRVPLPAGSTPVFDGCYKVANHSCMDRVLPPAGDHQLDCKDDVTNLVTAVAPAGHGPVISSLDGVVDYGAQPAARGRFAPAPLVETVTWCVESSACTVVVEAAQETAAGAAVAATATASISWLVVIGGGILLGLAFFALYEILFPTPINIAGLIEYPIHVTDNFDTFSNWGEDKGKWIDSLKIYAQVVKTTNELTADHNLPFAWGALEESHLRSTIDRACAVQQGKPSAFAGCGDGFAVYVPGGVNYRFRPFRQTGDHIVDAISNDQIAKDPPRVQWFYPAYDKGGKAASVSFSRRWYDRPPFAPNVCTSRIPSLEACDEFPFFTTDQAVVLSRTLADIRPTPLTESKNQGNEMSQFYDQCEVNDGDRFLVLPVKSWVEANGPSFGFRVDPGGTSLCLKPSLPTTAGGP